MSYTLLHGTRAPVKIWTDPWTIDEGATRQLRNIGALPWVEGVAVMPDVHYGKGATVGSVIAMRQALAPAAVGVDIGCGMSAVRTNLTDADLPDDLGALRSAIEATIPVGFHAHAEPVNPRRLHGMPTAGWDTFWNGFGDLHSGVAGLRTRAERQLGSLGGGNHFIEVCVEQGGPDAGRVWLMLHSGSRNIGKELAERHISVARQLPHNADLPDRDLAVFVTGTPEMDAYRRDLTWAQEYAARNRALMLMLLCGVVRDAMPSVRFDEPISCHHNYVAEETYDGVELLVTRKGAIRAGRGDLGIIPGSMGTGSYIVRGLGNTDAYCSASHGAGRRMSRAKAKKSFTVADLAEQTAGVECRKDAGVVDEIPGAYKDLGAVIKQQADLVEVVAHLKQVICVKGGPWVKPDIRPPSIGGWSRMSGSPSAGARARWNATRPAVVTPGRHPWDPLPGVPGWILLPLHSAFRGAFVSVPWRRQPPNGALTMNTMLRKSVLSVAGLVFAGGAVVGPAVAAQAAPAQGRQTVSVQNDRPDRADRGDHRSATRGDRVLGTEYQAQPNFYYCGPAATRIALSAQGKVLSQDEVAKKLGTTEAGTNSAEDTTRVLNEVTGGKHYRTTAIPGPKAGSEQIDRLRADVVKAVDDKRAVVANIKGTAVDTEGNPHAYEGGHYLSVVGYRDGGDTVRIADPFDPNEHYWMDVDKLANWIVERGYSS